MLSLALLIGILVWLSLAAVVARLWWRSRRHAKSRRRMELGTRDDFEDIRDESDLQDRSDGSSLRGRAYRTQAGRDGEAKVAKILLDAGVPAAHDLTLRVGDQSAQVDHLALVGENLLVIETKNWSGRLRGEISGDRWIKIGRNGTSTSHDNPLTQNQWHVDVIRRIVGGDVPIAQVVVLIGEPDLDLDDWPEDVCYESQLPGYLRNMKKSAPSGATNMAFRRLKAYGSP